MTAAHTTPLAEAVVAVVVAMVGQDVLATGMSLAQSRIAAIVAARKKLRWRIRLLPGVFDGLNDYASRVGTSITAGAYVLHGFWSWECQLLLFLTAITSFATDTAVTPWEAGLITRMEDPT